MRRPLAIAAAATVVLLPAPAGAAAVPVVVLEGRGHGHGVGMAQDGAYWMGRGGASTAQILNQFYPGTTQGRSGGEVRVTVLATAGATVLGFPGGGEIRDARDGGHSAGFPVRLGAGGQARVRFDGRQYAVEILGGGMAAAPAPTAGQVAAPAGGGPTLVPAQEATTTTTTPPTTTGGLGLLQPGKPLLPLPTLPAITVPTTTTTTTAAVPTTAAPAAAAGRASSPGGLWAVPAGGGTVAVPERSHRYRGVLQVVGSDGLRLVNHVDVEQYLRGMGEVRNPSWPAASLRAQAIAARTYALRAMTGGGQLCDTQQCQVYLGAEAEYAAMDKAVTATRGQVVFYRRGLASTVYSANGGGFSASTEEGFGTPGAGFPYLRPARYQTSDPSPWSLTVSLRDVAARVGYRGRISAIRTESAGPSGRVLQVVLEGSGGRRAVRGVDFDRALGLKSTLFTVKLAESATAPPPPPPAEGPLGAA
ncbi:MAG: SpoIID/LytB domain-containing protein, partial [Acidimicrobiales bacterium]